MQAVIFLKFVGMASQQTRIQEAPGGSMISSLHNRFDEAEASQNMGFQSTRAPLAFTGFSYLARSICINAANSCGLQGEGSAMRAA
jgi:hypothetical protein